MGKEQLNIVGRISITDTSLLILCTQVPLWHLSFKLPLLDQTSMAQSSGLLSFIRFAATATPSGFHCWSFPVPHLISEYQTLYKGSVADLTAVHVFKPNKLL